MGWCSCEPNSARRLIRVENIDPVQQTDRRAARVRRTGQHSAVSKYASPTTRLHLRAASGPRAEKVACRPKTSARKPRGSTKTCQNTTAADLMCCTSPAAFTGIHSVGKVLRGISNVPEKKRNSHEVPVLLNLSHLSVKERLTLQDDTT